MFFIYIVCASPFMKKDTLEPYGCSIIIINVLIH